MKNINMKKNLCSVILFGIFFVVVFSVSNLLFASDGDDIEYSPLYEASLKNTLREFKEKEESIFKKGANEAVLENPTRADRGDDSIVKLPQPKNYPGFGSPFPSYTTSYSCGATCGVTCGATCGATCTVTCGATCGSTCGATCGPTCGSTCSATCVGNSTCIGGATCAGSSTCYGTSTCMAGKTCFGSSTCAGSATCQGSSTCIGSSTCTGSSTCSSTGSCNGEPEPTTTPPTSDPISENTEVQPDEPSKWARKEVESAIALEMVPCHLKSNYKSDINREEFCELAIALFKVMLSDNPEMIETLNTDLGSPFDDTDNVAVSWAYNLKIVNGVGDNKFEPKRGITRQEAAKMLHNICVGAMGMDGSAPNASFSDEDKISKWAADSVNFVVYVKVMNGVGENQFQPLGSYTREQAIATMYRLYINAFIDDDNDDGNKSGSDYNF